MPDKEEIFAVLDDEIQENKNATDEDLALSIAEVFELGEYICFDLVEEWRTQQ